MPSNKSCEPKVFLISGATASGKSAIALEIAKKHNGAIINADSLQIYRELPILSSQPTLTEQSLVEHYLYGIFSAEQKLSVGIWLKMVEDAVNKILSQNKIPIIVGGAGMYISKLIDGIANIPEIDEDFRKEAKNLYDKIGHQEFTKIYAQKIYDDGKIIDKQKLLRRAEIMMATGNDIEYFQQQKPKKILEDCKIIHFNLSPNRDLIYQNCNQRFMQMLDNGALREVKDYFTNKNFIEDSAINKTLGFQEIIDFLQNNIPRERMIELATQKTRNYAKRQLTWFRHQFKDIIIANSAEEISEIFLRINKS